MTFSLARRKLILLATTALPLINLLPSLAFAQNSTDKLKQATLQLENLQKASGGQLGIMAINYANSEKLALNAHMRFPFCSTFKVMAISAVLHHSATNPNFLKKHIQYSPKDIVSYSPISAKNISQGMTIAQLCAAALQYSDNAAVNILIRELGGLDAINNFARAIGDNTFRLDRWETDLNSAIPGDERDTTTPEAMAASLQKLLLGDALPPAEREQLINWMKDNTTGDKRIRAGVPSGWVVADKTGSGDYGASNDIAIIWPPEQQPLIVTIYFTHPNAKMPFNDTIIAQATRIIVSAFL